MDEISEQCGASVRPIVEGVGLVKDNLGILLSGEWRSFHYTDHMQLAAQPSLPRSAQIYL